jgi:MFS transporter, PPP family, 3-phenylpropionic acid transporter
MGVTPLAEVQSPASVQAGAPLVGETQDFAHLSTRVSAVYAAVYLHYGAFGLFLPLWFADRGLGAEQIGTLMALPMLLRIFFVAPVTNLADRLRRIREVLLVCVLVAMVLMAGMNFAGGYWQLLVFFTVFSLVWDPLPILVDSYAVLAVRAQRLDFGRMRLWGSLAFIAANVAAGKMIEVFSVEIVPWLTAALLAIPVLPILLLPPDRLLGTQEKAGKSEWRRILADRGVMGVMVAAALVASSHVVVLTFGAIQWTAMGLSGGTIGGLIGVAVFAEIVVLFAAQKLLGGRSPLWLIVIGAVVGVVRWLVMATNPGLPVLVILALLNGLTGMGAITGLMLFIAQRVESNLISTAQGINAVLVGVLAAIATAASGFAWRALGEDAYLAMAAMAAAGGLIAVRALRKTARA